MRVAVINCSASCYNVGALKLADWLGNRHGVTYFDGDPGLFAYGFDLVCLSVIFSWDALVARDIALRVKTDADVWCGGPGMYTLERWWKRETGLTYECGLDWRFERQRGNYRMAFASRGCPVNCWFCIVPKMEGTSLILDWKFQPAPILCDNNLSALPADFQEHIIKRYQENGIVLEDANSGFEPRTFDGDCYHRWRPVLRGPWRFGFDEMSERDHVERMMQILKDEPARSKQVYVLIGNEPIESCHERVKLVIEWGGEPYCQPVLPLNAMARDQFIIRHDWTAQRLRDFARWVNRWLWRNTPLWEYAPRKNKESLFLNLQHS